MGNSKSIAQGQQNAYRSTYGVRSPLRRSTVACTTQNEQRPKSRSWRQSVQSPADDTTNSVILLYEVIALALKVHRHLSDSSGHDIRTDAVWATIPSARNGQSSKVLLADRHQKILTKREQSALFQELKHQAYLATCYYHLAQRDQTMVAHFLDDAPLLQEIQHPHLLKLYGHFMCNRTLHVQTEYCHRGNLALVLAFDERYESKRSYRLPIFRGLSALKEMARQLCSAVAFLHDNRLAHTNLRPENVFINDQGHLLVGDFKDAVLLDTISEMIILPPPLHRAFAAPERFDDVDGGDIAVDLLKADAWSVGALVFAFVTRQCLFAAASPLDPDFQDFKKRGFAAYYETWEVEAKSRDGMAKCVPKDIKALLSELLQVDPSKRSSIADVTRRVEWLLPGGLLADIDPSEWSL
jgi:serine/threonine protein kinase